MKWYKIYSALLICLLTHQLFGQISIQVSVAPPYPVRFSDYTDFDSHIFVTLTNTTNTDYTIYLTGSLKNEEAGINIYSQVGSQTTEIIMPANSTKQLDGSDLSSVFDPHNMIFTGPITLSSVTADQALPQGDYQLCLRAFNYYNPNQALSNEPDVFQGCASIPVEYVEPPIIPETQCGHVFDDSQSAYTFTWLPPTVLQMQNIRYRVRMVEVLNDNDPNNAFDIATSPYLLDTGNLMSQVLNLYQYDDLTLEDGKTYAWRVIAYDETHEVQFENNGQSEVCWFTYSDNNDAFQFTSVYPKNGDYLPFDFYPFIVKFSPMDDNYRSYDGNISVYDENGHLIDSETSESNWGYIGPYVYQQRNVFSDITEEQASHLPVYKNITETTLRFMRGAEYSYSFDGQMTMRNGTVKSDNFSDVTFHAGMAPVAMQLPANASTVAPGSVQMTWEPVEPAQLFPPFNIVRVEEEHDDSREFFEGLVDEQWVLEVSKSNDFDSIYYTKNERINDISLQSEPALVRERLYSNITADTAFIEPGTYYWRVKWLKQPGNLNSEAYSTSEVWSFIIGDSETPVATEEDAGECLSGCEVPTITDRTAVGGVEEGSTIKIGLFDLNVTSITSSTDNHFTGVGEVEVTFLKFKALVDFTDIQVNAAHQIFSGTVTAKNDRDFPYRSIANNGVEAVGMDESDAIDLNDYLQTGERLVSLFTGNRAIGLPIGIDKDIDGRQFTIAILGMDFTPERASLMAVANIDLNLFGDTQFFSAGIGDFCFSPTGFGKEGKAFLPEDHTFELRNGASFALKGLSSATSLNDSSSYSYFNWDCKGFKCVNLLAEYKFSRNIIVPDGPDGIPGDGQVTATMNLKACRGMNFMASIDMEPFQIPTDALEGYAFVVDEAWLDQSDLDNPTDFMANLPSNYVHPALQSTDSRLQNTWTGFWLKRLHLKIPEYVGNVERERVSAGIDNLIIDDTGFTCSLGVENIVTWEEEGNVDGYAFSIDRLYVDILQSNFSEAGIEGKVGLPINDEREYLEYNGLVDHTSGGTGFRFIVKPADSLSFPILIAKAELAPTSTFEIALGRDNYIGVDLNGKLSLSSDNQPGEGQPGRNNALDLDMPGITFQHLKLNSRDGFDRTNFTYSLASPQKNMSGFPISLDELSLGLDGMNPSLTIQPRLTLAGESNGFSAAANITINSTLDESPSGRKKFRLTGIDLNAIHLNVESSSISLEGYLEFYDEASAKGVRGTLGVKLPMGIAANLKAEFGTYRAANAVRFNTANYYSYWYVEGMVTFGEQGLSLFPSLNLYGLGGGVYHHMRQSGVPQVNQVMANGTDKESASPTTTGISYVRDFDTSFGLKFMALFGAPGGGKAYNFDVTLEAAFSPSHGLNHLGFKGQVRVLTEGINSTDNAPIMGFVDINYWHPPGGDKTLEGSMGMTADYYVLKGTGTMTSPPAWYTGPTDNFFVMANFYVGPDQWYYYMGNPDNRAGLKLSFSDSDASLLEINSYLMIGYGIPANLPPPSQAFLNIFMGGNPEKFSPQDGGQLSELANGTAERDVDDYQDAKGFAFGSSFSTSLHANPIPFYFDISMAMGFDINVTQSYERTCIESGMVPGKNGWYAQGQFYAGIEGSFGIEVKLFRRRRFPIFEMGAGMLLKGGLPNPAFAEGKARIRYSLLNGLFKGNFKFTAQIGTPCTTVTGGALSGIEILQDLQPEDGDRDVDVFTTCTAAFSLPLNEILEIPREDDWEGSQPPIRIRPFVDSWTLKENNHTAIPTDDVEYLEENTIAELVPKIVLKGNTPYTQKITLKAIEYYADGSQRLLDWEETKSTTFITGDAPDHIVEDNILFTYPLKNQQYFLKGETQGGKGYIQMNRADPNNFSGWNAQEFKTHDFKVRYIELGTDNSFEVPLKLTNGGTTINFNVSDLQNDTYYALQVLKVKIDQPDEDSHEAYNLEDRLAGTNANNNLLSNNTRVSNLNLINNALGKLSSDILKKRTLPGPKTKNAQEHLLYHYYFKTDMSDLFESKVQNVSITKDYSHFGQLEMFTLSFSSNAKFDTYDGRGLTKSYRRRVYPLVKVTVEKTGGEFATSDNPVNYYYTSKVGPYIELPWANLRHVSIRNHLPAIPNFIMTSDRSAVRFSSESPFLAPISEAQLERANNPTSGPSAIQQARQTASGSSSSISFGLSASLQSFASTYEPPKFEVVHMLSVSGLINFQRTKSLISGYFSRRFPMIISPGSDPLHYANQYRQRYGNSRQANFKPISDYFIRFQPTYYGAILRAIFRSDDTMMYPATTASDKHSFILQYQYPMPGRSLRAIKGTSKRFTFNHNN